MPQGHTTRNVLVIGLAAAAIVASAALIAIRPRPAALAVTGRAARGSSDDPMSDLPRLILWAWERPEDLRFINPQEVGVAYLAATVTISGDRVAVRPRLQPLALAPDTRRIAVARIETANHPPFSDEQRRRVAAALVRLAQGEAVAAVQIDFDALSSERAFYRALLVDLRNELPAATRLSITALASWCFGDNWISDLPVDEAVPMLFRMGADDNHIRMRLKAGDEFSAAVARHSVGVSTDEPVGARFTDRRVYVFDPRPWTADGVRQIIREVQFTP